MHNYIEGGAIQNTSKDKRHSFSNILTLLLLLILSLVSVFPPMMAFGGTSAICLAAEILLLFIAMLQNSNVFLKICSNNIGGLLFVVYTFFFPYFFGNSVISHRYSSVFILVFGVILFEFYNETNRMFIVREAVAISVPFFLLTFIRTVIVAQTSPWVIRSIKTSGDDIGLSAQGIGGYEFIYMLSLIFAFLFICFMKDRKVLKKLLYLFGMVMILSLILMANYMTAMLLSFLSVVIAFAMSGFENLKNGKGIKGIIGIVVVFAVFLLLFIFADAIFSLLIRNLHTGGRIYEVLGSGDSLFDAVREEFMVDRYPTIKLSWDSFLKHPVFGIVTEKIVTSGGYLVGFGQHSFIVDTFALYGGFIGIIGVIQVLKPYKRYAVYKNNITYRYALGTHFLLLALLNNLNFSTIFLSTIILPCLAEYLLESKGRRKNVNRE